MITGEHGPELTGTRYPWPAYEDKRHEWAKLLEKHEHMKRSTMAYKSRMTILVQLRELKG